MHVQRINKLVRNSRVVILLTFLLALTTLSTKSVGADSQVVVPAIADAYVDNANPETNYGSSLFLFTHYYSESVAQASAGSSTQNEVGPVVRTWLKFDLSQVPTQASINSATLRIHTAMWGTRSSNKVGVFVSEDASWTELDISWNNAPSDLSSNPLDTLECADPDLDYNFDVLSALNGRKSISLMLETLELSKEPAVFNSKDIDNDTGPTLIVDYTLPIDFGLIGLFGLGIAIVVIVFAALILRSKKRNNPN